MPTVLKRMIPLMLVIFIQVSLLPCRAADSSPAAVDAPKTTSELEQAIERVLHETNTPGLSIAIISPNQPLYVSAFGVADRQSNKRVTTETMFRAGSISKCFTALAILQLQESGKLELDALVRELAPDVQLSNRWEQTEPLRLVHLLEHTAGFDEISFREFATNKLNSQLTQDINFDPNPRTVRWPPGQFFSYSNADYSLAGYILEKVSGRSYDEVIASQLLKPLAMPGATFLYSENLQQRLATGYGLDGITPREYEHILGRSSGALNCTPTELANLVQMLIHRGKFNGEQILTPESIARMETPTASIMARRGIRDGYGLANFTTSHKGHRIHGHSGGMNGYGARYGYSIEHGVGFVFMFNGGNGEVFQRVEKLILSYLSQDWPQPSRPEAVRSTDDQLAQYAGFYEIHTPRFEKSRFLFRLLELKQVSIHEGTLRWRALFGKWDELRPFETEGSFGGLEDAGPTLLFFNDGGETYCTSALLGTENHRRIPSWQVWGQAAMILYCGLMIPSAVLFSLIWVPRKLLGYMRDVNNLIVRSIPLLATLSFLGIFVVIMSSLDDPINMLARPTLWSVGIWALTWLLAILSPLGIALVYFSRRSEMNRWVWWHSLHVSIANLIVLAYLAYWGIIGVRTWI